MTISGAPGLSARRAAAVAPTTRRHGAGAEREARGVGFSSALDRQDFFGRGDDLTASLLIERVEKIAEAGQSEV